jgi:hypothetical protein
MATVAPRSVEHHSAALEALHDALHGAARHGARHRGARTGSRVTRAAMDGHQRA